MACNGKIKLLYRLPIVTFPILRISTRGFELDGEDRWRVMYAEGMVGAERMEGRKSGRK